MKKKNKFISLLTGMCVIMTLLPQITFAEKGSSPSGSGTEQDPYLISTADDMVWLSKQSAEAAATYYFNKPLCARLVADIDLSTLPSWTPIDGYCSVFDGNNHTVTVKNQCVISSVGYSVTGWPQTGTVKNLIVDGSITGDFTNLGSPMIAYAKGTVENCVNKAVIDGTCTSSASYMGGVVGYMGTGSIKNCKNEANLTVCHMTVHGIGGVIGYCGGVMNNCTNTGAISLTKLENSTTVPVTGGIAGNLWNSTSMTNCVNTGDVTGYKYVGGLVGQVYVNKSQIFTSSISGCINKGNVTCTAESGFTYTGGLFGDVNGTSSNDTIDISNCYNTGIVTDHNKEHNYVAGLVGSYDYCIKMTRCCHLGTVTSCGEYSSNDTENCPYLLKEVEYLPKPEKAVNYFDRCYGINDSNRSQFKSGEITYLLNGSSSEGVWKQTLATDDYPSFTGLTVYYDETRTTPYYNITGDAVWTNTVLKKITAEETQDKSTATAVLSEIKPNGNTIESITWSYSVDDQTVYNAEYTTKISGESTVFFGIVVPTLLNADVKNTTDEITVTID